MKSEAYFQVKPVTFVLICIYHKRKWNIFRIRTMTRKDIIEQGLLSASSPVDPTAFTTRVASFLKTHGVLVSNDTPKVIEKLCQLFNFSISNPKIGGLLNRKNILIYPAQTGIGKSVSIQHYVAMLGQESSLVVVNTIQEAEDYCRNINSIKQQEGYARFVASKKTKNRNQLWGAELMFLENVQCLILTHNMFKRLHSYSEEELNRYRLYKTDNSSPPKPRDLVVIDERLSFLSKKVLKFSELEGIGNFLEETVKHSPRFKNDKAVKQQFGAMRAVLDVIGEEHSEGRASFIDRLSIEPKLENRDLPIRIYFKLVSDAVAARLDEINDEVSLLKPSKIANLKDIKNGVIKTLNTFMDVTCPNPGEEDVTHTGGEEVYREFAIYNKDLFRVRSIYNQFGTAVVLDATAEVNSFYELSSNSNSSIDIVEAPKIRKYEKLTIYKAQGFPQSANAIFEKNRETALGNIDWYGRIIREILDDDDKLLVISFKKFIRADLPDLEDEFIGDDRVRFTNWGKHVGRNEWSDCNKVIIIGWLRLPEEEYVSKLFHISSLGTSDMRTMKHVTPDKIKELQRSEIADDLVQGAMRCCARIIDTADSDCKPASVFLFEDVLDGSDQVIKLFEAQFPKAKIVNWAPKATPPKSVLSIPDQKKEEAIERLLELSESHASYSRSEFCKEFRITPSTLKRWLDNGHFKVRLAELGFRIEKPEGKPERFFFR